MQRIDETAIHTLGIPRLLLMDAAGRATARAVIVDDIGLPAQLLPGVG